VTLLFNWADISGFLGRPRQWELGKIEARRPIFPSQASEQALEDGSNELLISEACL